MTDFVHLHVHSEYSLLDGLSRPEEIASVVSSNGQYASALTDHGRMGGYLRFQEACKAEGVKPIFGVEAYFVPDVNSDDDDKKKERYHLILLAKNDNGLRNLYKLNNKGWIDQFHGQPRIDFNNLEAWGDDIICLSGCMGGVIAQHLMAGEPSDLVLAEEYTQRFQNIFGDDFYMEIQPWNEGDLNKKLIELAGAYEIKVVGTADCHYPTADDKGTEELLLCMNQHGSMSAPDKRYAKEHVDEARREPNLVNKMDILYPNRRLSFADFDPYIQTYDSLAQQFVDAGVTDESVLSNTMEVAEKCNAEIKYYDVLLPSYTKSKKIPMDSGEYLREIAEFQMKELGLTSQEYVDRLEEELETIIGKKFSDYFLILWDVITWSDSVGIARGPARGSAAGCLLAYVLGITAVDPVKHDLLFFRFINPEREDFPDIDIDFQHDRRDEVKQYLVDTWGREYTAGIGTYGLFKAKSVFKKITSTYCVPFNEANEVTKHFESLDEYDDPKDKVLMKFREKWPDVKGHCERLEGLIQSAGHHAAGILVSSLALDDVLPLETRAEKSGGERIVVTAYDKDEVAKLGLIKNDFLGLNAVTVVSEAIKKIKDRHGIDVTAMSLDIDNPDPDVLHKFNEGDLVGTFQTEGGGYAATLEEMEIDSFMDLVVSNALIRPGAFVTQGRMYLDRKMGIETPTYDHEILEEVLGDTFGAFIFEEQVMLVSTRLCGFTQGKSNTMRKVISKKKDQAELDAYKEDFVNGAAEKIGRAAANGLWAAIEKASLYMFNKSHSLSYSLLSYQTMWLKHHYPLEFMWATLRYETDPEKITTYLFEARRLGLEIVAPDVNDSSKTMDVVGDKLMFGLTNVAGVGDSAADEIIKKRPYRDFDEFKSKVVAQKVKANIVENMERVGCFESIGHFSGFEKEMYYGPILNYPVLMDRASKFDDILDACDDASNDKESLHIIRGVVTGTKKTKTYYRVEIEDSTGAYSGFLVDRALTINKRDYVIALVGDNSIHYIEDFVAAEAAPNSEFSMFLHKMADSGLDFPYEFLLENNVSAECVEGAAICYIMSVSTFITKAGKEMAYIYAFFPAEGFKKLVMFNYKWEALKKFVKTFTWSVVMLSDNEGSMIMNNIASADKYCDIKGIVNYALLERQKQSVS